VDRTRRAHEKHAEGGHYIILENAVVVQIEYTSYTSVTGRAPEIIELSSEAARSVRSWWIERYRVMRLDEVYHTAGVSGSIH
jgi:hypothetical protein